MQKIHWTRVYEQQAGALLGVAYRYVKDRRQAEDIVQNAFIIAMQKADTFKGTGVFEAWLRRIVVNESLMYLRAKNPVYTGMNEQIEAMPDEEVALTDDATTFQTIEHAEFSQDDLLETANLLPDHHRMVFYMYVVDGFSHKDIAQQLSISEGTSKSHLNRARKKLQDLLYQKALDMKKHRKKSLALFAWLFALFGKAKANPIDIIYKDAFANFALPVPPIPPGLEVASTSVSVGLSSGAIVGIAGSVVGGAAIVGTVVYQVANNSSEPPTEVETVIEYEQPAEPVWLEDTVERPTIKPIIPAKEQVEIEVAPETEPVEEALPPVVIKRTTVIEVEDTTNYEN
ncbi:MAG: sigma-70 family RNA polymerase sigma factor [Bacteroidales bacterium]|jgi:RNA polymerase sigma factor (sigma-70 family)|nr:sigma-70 family RNA polymerase sigma factor [Bacteroidales bacterium]